MDAVEHLLFILANRIRSGEPAEQLAAACDAIGSAWHNSDHREGAPIVQLSLEWSREYERPMDLG